MLAQIVYFCCVKLGSEMLAKVCNGPGIAQKHFGLVAVESAVMQRDIGEQPGGGVI